MKKKMPSVVIVGRTNVGKSTLFNRLSEKVKSITLDYRGVTRDIITDVICWKDRCFELVDTGGISLQKMSADPIAELARQRAFQAIDEADLVLFVCDGTVGITQEDQDIARFLRKKAHAVIVLVNKIDTAVAQGRVHEFERLGFPAVIALSAQHGIGILDLFEALYARLPERALTYDESEEPACKVVILGKPNVGKSSLMNLILQRERAIVTPMPGTTREPIKESVRFFQEVIQIIDTPGVRRKRGVTEPIEKLMVKSALRTVDEADVVLLVIDASQARMVDQELKLAFYVFEEKHKGLIILFNKDDLVTEQMRADLEFHLEPYVHFLNKIIQMKISCVSRKNIGKVLTVVDDVCKRYRQSLNEQDLTSWLQEASQRKSLYSRQQRLFVHRARQVRTSPVTIELAVNEPRLFGPSHIGFLDNMLRKRADLKGVPVRFILVKSRVS